MENGQSKKLSDYLSANKESHLVVPIQWCPHLEDSVSKDELPDTISTSSPCADCGNVGENWYCLQCRSVRCGRYVNGHAVEHSEADHHPHKMALSLADLSVWCYACDFYVDNETVYPYKNLAHLDKFGEPMPKPAYPIS